MEDEPMKPEVYQHTETKVSAILVTPEFFFTMTDNAVKKQDFEKAIGNLEHQIKEVKSDLEHQIKEVKSDLENQIKEIKADIKDVRNEIKDVRSELKEDIHKVEVKLENQINEVKEDVKDVRNEVKSNFKWTISTLITLFVTVGGGLGGLMIYIITKLPH